MAESTSKPTEKLDYNEGMVRGFYIYILSFIFVGSSTALGQNISQQVEGSLRFIPYQHYSEAYVQLLRGPEENADLYKQQQTHTWSPFGFCITVDPEIHLEDLYVKIVVHEPKDFCCALRELRACERERLIDIPIRRKSDLVYKASQRVRAAIELGNVDEAKRKLAQVGFWATSGNQVLVPCLDLADFLAKYKPKRECAMKILTEVEDWAGGASIGVQKRYWRSRRDATMRLAGFNDFKKMPVEEFAEAVACIENPIAWKTWTDFTVSFAQSYKENYDKWEMMTKARLTQDELNSLWVFYPTKQQVLGQLRSLDPVLGPAIVAR